MTISDTPCSLTCTKSEAASSVPSAGNLLAGVSLAHRCNLAVYAAYERSA